MNAKTEFLSTVNGYIVIGAIITIQTYNWNVDVKLNPGYTEEEYEIFLKSIDQEYDDGYGSQELFGTIFCENNIWFDRYEYDGSENWIEYQYPDLRSNFDEKFVVQYERSKKLERIQK